MLVTRNIVKTCGKDIAHNFLYSLNFDIILEAKFIAHNVPEDTTCAILFRIMAFIAC
jgi:hypothetical protein